jgi:hypothetical protein
MSREAEIRAVRSINAERSAPPTEGLFLVLRLQLHRLPGGVLRLETNAATEHHQLAAARM